MRADYYWAPIMWFRNLHIFRLGDDFILSPEQLHEALLDQQFKPCAALSMSSYGWVPPLGRQGTELVHAAAASILLCARNEEKVLPSSVVREEVEQRIADIEEKEARPVRRKEHQRIKDEVIFELTPKAFVRSSLTYAYIDTRNGWVIVDAASLKKAEELLSLLRRSLGKLSAQPIRSQQSPGSVMTHWLSHANSGQFVPQDECELREPSDDGGVLRCRHQDLHSEEILGHIHAGKQVTRLAISWAERLSCIIDSDLSLKRLRFEDVVADELEQVESDDELALFDARFALMSLELHHFIPALLEAFGGEDEALQ